MNLMFMVLTLIALSQKRSIELKEVLYYNAEDLLFLGILANLPFEF